MVDKRGRGVERTDISVDEKVCCRDHLVTVPSGERTEGRMSDGGRHHLAQSLIGHAEAPQSDRRPLAGAAFGHRADTKFGPNRGAEVFDPAHEFDPRVLRTNIASGGQLLPVVRQS